MTRGRFWMPWGALHEELTELRAQRRAVLALCDARQRYIVEDEPDSLPVVWIKDVRSALGGG